MNFSKLLNIYFIHLFVVWRRWSICKRRLLNVLNSIQFNSILGRSECALVFHKMTSNSYANSSRKEFEWEREVFSVRRAIERDYDRYRLQRNRGWLAERLVYKRWSTRGSRIYMGGYHRGLSPIYLAYLIITVA